MIQDILFSLADALVMFGVLVITVSIYGLFRMPDIYTRLHAASKAVVMGVIPIALASAITLDPTITYRSVLIAAFLLITTPISSHAIGRAAYLRGVPMITCGAIDECRSCPPDLLPVPQEPHRTESNRANSEL